MDLITAILKENRWIGKTANPVDTKVIAILHGKKIKYTGDELQEMLDKPKMYNDADNLPKWLMLALVKSKSNRDFTNSFQKGLDLIKEWKNSDRTTTIELTERKYQNGYLNLKIR